MDIEITPEELKSLRERGEPLKLIDVREAWELQTACIEGAVNIPLGDVPTRAHQELDPDGHIVVVCHHGVRSMNVAHWLRQEGFANAQSMSGGIDAWAKRIDPEVPVY